MLCQGVFNGLGVDGDALLEIGRVTSESKDANVHPLSCLIPAKLAASFGRALEARSRPPNMCHMKRCLLCVS